MTYVRPPGEVPNSLGDLHGECNTDVFIYIYIIYNNLNMEMKVIVKKGHIIHIGILE